MGLPRRSAPWWFVALVALTWACAWRALDHAYPGVLAPHGAGPGVQLAFWQFLIGVVEWIWNGFQAAGQAVINFLVWAYGALSAAVAALVNGLAAAGHALLLGLKRVWDFFGRIYEDVLKPAWQKFWGWFDKFTKWLDRTVRPLLNWLIQLRKTLMAWWTTWIRPWLDLIDVTRKLLRTLGALGLQWARALDQRLGDIEAAIEKPFRFVLAQLNQIIDIVNRVVTLDGLIQRVALIKSLARDYQFAWRAIAAPYTRSVTTTDRKGLTDALAVKPLSQIESETRQYVRGGGGPRATLIDEMTTIWRQQLRDAR